MKCYLLDQMQEQTEIDKAGEYVILSDKQNWIRDGEKLGIYADVDTINMNGHFSKVIICLDRFPFREYWIFLVPDMRSSFL